MEFSYFMPVRLLFGANVIDQLGATAKSYGTHALIVTGRSSTKRSGLLDRSIALLEAAGVRATVFNKVEPNPLTTTVMEGAALAIAVIQHVRRLGAKVAATTHYAELKTFAMTTAGVENASCEFNVGSLAPT